MKTRTLRLEFVTPAFLGGADQSSEWRTPPIKALLRQWWRVWAAREFGGGHEGIREIEGVIFGHAALKHNGKPWHIKSPVILRLAPVETISLDSWSSIGRVRHPEVGKGTGMDVGADLYLGYGPLLYEKGAGTKLKAPPALGPGSSAVLSLRYPRQLPIDDFTTVDLEAGLDAALRLIHLFGTIGSRSRNGWGSLRIEEGGNELDGLNMLSSVAGGYSKSLEEALKTEWPDSIGRDQRGLLVWRTRQEFRNAQDAMKELARVKIAFRTKLEPGQHGIAERHLLGYPVTHHSVKAWGNSGRLASQLRFKVHRLDGGQFIGIAFHLPCGLPERLLLKLDPGQRRWVQNNEFGVWKKVHGILDKEMARWK